MDETNDRMWWIVNETTKRRLGILEIGRGRKQGKRWNEYVEKARKERKELYKRTGRLRKEINGDTGRLEYENMWQQYTNKQREVKRLIRKARAETQREIV